MPGETMIDLSAVRKFINAELLYREDQQLDREANLIEGGVLDSMTLIRLISFLEEHYGIDIPDQEILPDNFRSMSAIETFLARHVVAAHPETKSKGSSQ
jgi:acyl carrier protein